MTNLTDLTTVQNALDALKAARVYVDNAYDAAFPDDGKNAQVLADIDQSMLSLTALQRKLQGILPAVVVEHFDIQIHGDPTALANRLLYVAPEAIESINAVKHAQGPWTNFPPHYVDVCAWLSREPHVGDRLHLRCALGEVSSFGKNMTNLDFRIAHIDEALNLALECSTLLVQHEASKPIAQMTADGASIVFLGHRTSVPEGTQMYLEPLVPPNS